MDKNLGTLLHFWAFPIHTGPTPPLTPQTMLDACIQNFFWISTLYRVGGELQEKLISKRMHCLMREPRMTKKRNIALLSQGLLSMIVDNIITDNVNVDSYFHDWWYLSDTAEHSQCSACERASSQLFMTMISKQNLKSINVHIFYFRPLVMMIEIH